MCCKLHTDTSSPIGVVNEPAHPPCIFPGSTHRYCQGQAELSSSSFTRVPVPSNNLLLPINLRVTGTSNHAHLTKIERIVQAKFFLSARSIPQNIVQCPIPEEIEILCTDAMLPNPLGCTLRLSIFHNSFRSTAPHTVVEIGCATNFLSICKPSTGMLYSCFTTIRHGDRHGSHRVLP